MGLIIRSIVFLACLLSPPDPKTFNPNLIYDVPLSLQVRLRDCLVV